MRDHASRAPRRFSRAVLLFAALLALPSGMVGAQQPPAQGTSPFWGSTPPKNANPFASPPPQQTTVPARPTSPVIAKIEGRAVTEADFDRIAQPYFLQLKAQFGPNFDRTMQRTASLNVLDELIKRELLAVEAQRQNLPVAQEEIDKILVEDPFFQTNGKFDAAKYNSYKSDPRSNYALILPRLRETAAMRKVDESLRQRFKPTPAQVRAEWAKRFDQVRFKMLTLMTREMPTEPEAPESEWAPYYRSHPEEFMRRARVRLRYLRLPLPVEGDSARAAEESHALARARGVADSLRRHTLPDSALELTDTGLFEVPATLIPGLGRVAGLIDTLAKVESDSTIRVVGPYVTSDGIYVGVLAERQGKRVPPMREVLGDVRRRADAEHRRVAIESERRQYYDAHRDHWRGTRALVTRVTLKETALTPKAPTNADVDRWYAQHGHRLFGKPDTSRAWMPPISDSLRTSARARMIQEQRTEHAAEAMGKIVAGLRATRDAKGLARANGAVAETLTFFPQSSSDSLWRPLFLDSLLSSAPTAKGTVQGPRAFGGYWTAWRVDVVDTSFVPTYEAARARSDMEFNQERVKKDEAEARTYFDQHRKDFKAPVKYALDYVAVAIPSTDSVRITEAEVRRRYDTNRLAYRQEEQVKARHILFMTRDLGPEVEKKAKTRADSLLAAIRQDPGDFAELAKRFSQEPGAGVSGGDLGWFGRGRMVKEFEEAAFALKPNEVSAVVKTMFGYHIIKVEDRKAAGTKPFVEVQSELRTQMAQARADSSALRAANALRRRLALGGDSKMLAARYGGVIALTPIAANEGVPALGVVQGLGQDLPTLSSGKWATKTYRAGNHYVVFRLRQKLPEHPADFDEARTQAMEAVRAEKRRTALEQKAKAIRSALAAGAPLDSLAAPYGGLRDSGPLVRSASFLPMLGPEPRVVEKAFAAKPGQTTDSLQVAQGLVWLRIEERKSGDPATLAAASTQIENDLLKKRYDAWVEEKKKTVKIEILRPDLKGPRTVATLNP